MCSWKSGPDNARFGVGAGEQWKGGGEASGCRRFGGEASVPENAGVCGPGSRCSLTKLPGDRSSQRGGPLAERESRKCLDGGLGLDWPSCVWGARGPSGSRLTRAGQLLALGTLGLLWGAGCELLLGAEC